MKKTLSSLDKVSLSFIILNYASFLAVFWVFDQPDLNGAADILAFLVMLYGVFGSVGGFFLGLSTSVLSLLQKRKPEPGIILPLLCLLLYLFMIPVYLQVFWLAALSV